MVDIFSNNKGIWPGSGPLDHGPAPGILKRSMRKLLRDPSFGVKRKLKGNHPIWGLPLKREAKSTKKLMARVGSVLRNASHLFPRLGPKGWESNTWGHGRVGIFANGLRSKTLRTGHRWFKELSEIFEPRLCLSCPPSDVGSRVACISQAGARIRCQKSTTQRSKNSEENPSVVSWRH